MVEHQSQKREIPIVRPVMPELDSARGIAVLLVFLFHSFGMNMDHLGDYSTIGRNLVRISSVGWTGVYLFFVLSGFLITGILIESKPKPHYFTRFYGRRVLRILPAYCALLLLLIVLPRLHLIHRDASWAFLGLSFLYMSNMTVLFRVPLQYGPLWSLAVEEHFYLFWPQLVRIMSIRLIGLASIFLVILVPLIRFFTYELGGLWRGLGSYTWQVADALALGAFMAVLVRLSSPRRKLLVAVVFTFVLALFSIFALGSRGIMRSSLPLGAAFRDSLVGLLCFSVIGTFLLIGSGSRARFVRWPILKFYGDISYGFYLVHTLVFDLFDRFVPASYGVERLLIRCAVVALFATAISWLSRRTLEEYFLRLKDRFPKLAARQPSPVPTAIAATAD
jgi:peptidoglycan/LPS O-acetylase OafA/YrhL